MSIGLPGAWAQQPTASAAPAPTSAYAAADAAYKAYSHGDYAEAVRKSREAVSLAPDNVEYRRLLRTAEIAVSTAVRERAYRAADRGYKAEARGEYVQAVKAAREAVALAPDNRDYRRLLVDALANAGNLSEAERLASDDLAREPTDAAMLVQRGYVRQRLGRFADAADDFSAALRVGLPSPAERRNVALSLADAAISAKQPQRAVHALQPYAAERSYAVASRLTFALLALGSKDEALAAASVAAELAATAQEKATMTTAEINLLVDLGRKAEAKARFKQASADGSLAAASNLDMAYLAVRIGDDATATDRFRRADEATALVGPAMLDAAYAAKRSASNAEAIDFFERAIDANAAGKLPLTAQSLFETRREVADLERTWGAYATLLYGAVGVMPSAPLAPPLTEGHLLQAGSEVYWRPPVIGNRDGRTVEIFARAFETLSDGTGGPTGAPTFQGYTGLRAKPFSAINLVIEGARLFAIGNDARDDWLARVAFSQGQGTDLRFDAANWTMWQIYAEYDRFFQTPETIASFEARFGRSFRVDAISDRLAVTPFLALGGGYDSRLATPGALGAGPGLGMRWWFREDKYTAPMSYVDLNVQYRFKLAGDNRARGVFAGLTLAF